MLGIAIIPSTERSATGSQGLPEHIRILRYELGQSNIIFRVYK